MFPNPQIAHLVTMHQFLKRVGTLLWRLLMFVEKTIYGHLQTFWKGLLCVIQEEDTIHSPIQRVQRLQSDVYKEDIVQCTRHKHLIGMVMKVADDSGESDDQYEEESIPKDCARIVWTDLSETTEKIGDIEVLDRVFFHGDIVASASDPSGQMGMVVNVDVTVDLSTPTSVALTNISARNVRRIRAFAGGDYVIHGPWLGRVDKVVDDVTVIFEDGSKCKVMNAHPDRLIPISKNLHYPYIPGQPVRGSSSAVFKNGIWLCGEWKKNSKEGTVCDVEVGSVFVNWIAAANPGYDSQSKTIPSEEQDPEQLKLLSCFSHTNWRLGDWCLLPTPERKISEVTLPATDDIVAHKEDNIVDGVLSVGNKRTRVDVIWQDGTRAYGVDSRTLVPIYNLLEYDLFSEQYILKEGSDDDGDASEARRVGIVKNVDSKERTARVRWLKSLDCDTSIFDGEELVSVYELAHHPDYFYYIGDIVIRLFPVSGETQENGIVNQLVGQIECKDETRPKNVFETTDLSTNQKILKKPQKAELDKSLEESHLSWIGNVIGLKDGDIEVAWADGMVSKVGPQQIFVVRRDEDDASVCNNAEEDDKDGLASWKAVDFDLVKLIFGKIDMEQKMEEDTVHMEQKMEEDRVHSLPSSSRHDLGHFKQFDSVKDPMDHFYHRETNQHINKRKWMKKVQQEWNVLQENLPDTIFVRIYEDRMDLLRAVIVGAAGTPYQDGLFFFDIHFPSEYPDVPPLVYYHSGGLWLNPNLSDNGKVCLSLLNTWTGRGNEVWNPSLSNSLQVLVSIQGLVLNANPYFNEPGYDKQFGSAKGEKESLAYKENSFLLSCKSMLYILRRPPKHFEMFVKEHFQKRGPCILRACDAYVKGAQVATLSEDCTLPSNVAAESENKSSSNVAAESENKNTSSAGFKLTLLKIVPKLISAFSEIGVDCQAFQQSIAKESKDYVDCKVTY